MVSTLRNRPTLNLACTPRTVRSPSILASQCRHCVVSQSESIAFLHPCLNPVTLFPESVNRQDALPPCFHRLLPLLSHLPPPVPFVLTLSLKVGVLFQLPRNLFVTSIKGILTDRYSPVQRSSRIPSEFSLSPRLSMPWNIPSSKYAESRVSDLLSQPIGNGSMQGRFSAEVKKNVVALRSDTRLAVIR